MDVADLNTKTLVLSIPTDKMEGITSVGEIRSFKPLTFITFNNAKEESF